MDWWILIVVLVMVICCWFMMRGMMRMQQGQRPKEPEIRPRDRKEPDQRE